MTRRGTRESAFLPALGGPKNLVFFLLSVLSASLFGYLMGASSSSSSSSSSLSYTNHLVGRVLTLHEVEDETVVHENVSEASGDVEEEEEGVWELADFSAIVIIVLSLIFLTILFEVAKEHLEESVSEDFEVILEKFFGELTVLGFLAMCTFLVSRTGVIQRISEHVFGKEEELVEYIEVVHFALFFVMVFFVIQVVIMIKVAEKQHHRWFEMDEKIGLEQSSMELTQTERDEIQTALHKTRRPWYSIFADCFCFSKDGNTAQQGREEIIFRLLRREFILDRSLSKPFRPADPEKRIPSTFQFGRYLALAQVHILSHVIEVQLSTWGLFAFMTCVFFVVAVVLNFHIEILQWIWVSLGWVVYLFNFVFAAHLLEIRNHFLPAESTEETEPDAKTGLVGAEAGAQEKLLPLWCFLEYEALLGARPILARWLVGGVPNRQQTLFWLDRHGPHLFIMFIQAELLFAGVYGAMLTIQFVPFAFRTEPLDIDLLFIALAVAPLAGILCNTDLVTLMSQVCSLGTYRKEQIVRDVLLEENITRIVRTLLIIHRMRWVAKEGQPESDTQQLMSQEGNVTFTELEEYEFGHSFDCFDADNSGFITKEEFREILTRLGAGMDDDHFDRIVYALDRNGDGKVTREEFIQWYKFVASKEHVPLREQAEDLFEMLDADGSGEVTLGEFKDNLETLDMGFTLDDIGSILNQVDRDRSGSVSLEEFELFVEKYFPRELSREGETTKTKTEGHASTSHHH